MDSIIINSFAIFANIPLIYETELVGRVGSLMKLTYIHVRLHIPSLMLSRRFDDLTIEFQNLRIREEKKNYLQKYLIVKV